MFVVVRSVFWLTVAYMVIKPGVDLPDAGALSAQALAAGKLIVAVALQPSPSAGLPMHEMPTINAAPIPRPRPHWAG